MQKAAESVRRMLDLNANTILSGHEVRFRVNFSCFLQSFLSPTQNYYFRLALKGLFLLSAVSQHRGEVVSVQHVTGISQAGGTRRGSSDGNLVVMRQRKVASQDGSRWSQVVGQDLGARDFIVVSGLGLDYRRGISGT